MRKIREVLRLHYEHGAKQREIASACGIGGATVHEYVRRAKLAGLTWPLPPEISDDELDELLFVRHPEGGPRALPDWGEIQRKLLVKGATMTVVWEEYRERHPDGYGRSQFCHLYREWAKQSEYRMPQSHVPGERMWVDWAGQTASVTDPETGEVSGVQIFVAAFGVSQKLFCMAFPSQALEHWLEAHALAFDFYGVLPQIAVPDNTKAGVTSPNRYEPELNLEYAELARHYSVAVLPARVRKPRDKAKVENGVLQIERRVLARLGDQRFFSLAELNERLATLTHELNERQMKGPRRSRNQLFEEVDRPACRPLPPSKFEFAKWKKAKVAPDYHVEFEGRRYSVPYPLVGKAVEVRAGASTIQIFAGNKLWATHIRSLSRLGFTTDPEHMPKGHRAYAEWTPARLVRWAGESGPDVAAFVSAMLETKAHPQQGFRAALGLIGLAKRYGPERLQGACARAFAYRALTYRSVKSILEKGLDRAPIPEEPPPLPVHDNVRGPGYYQSEAFSCEN